MARPEMNDPADKDLHTRSGKDPYPPPEGGVKDAKNPESDLEDPANTTPGAPHDRATAPGGAPKGARGDMNEKLGASRDDGKKGRTQDA